MLGIFVSQMVEKIEDDLEKEKLVRQNDVVLEEFMKLMRCTTRLNFYAQVKDM